MLYRKNVAKYCAYCTHAGVVDGKVMLCKRKGFVPCSYHCYRFRYDPLKRTPPRITAKDFSKFDEQDFSL